MINENQLLNTTLEIYENEGMENAYEYIKGNYNDLKIISSQVYNFLYCLASTCGKVEEALEWMEEAIVDKGLWYRPEVFEDEDLDSLRLLDRFKEYKDISDKKYRKALNAVKTECTWSNKASDNLLLVLHGNQQNNDISKEYWSDVEDNDWQIEYLQSSEIDSFNLFRWNDEGNGPKQVEEVIERIDWNKYGKRALAGFSAGCNTILRLLEKKEIDLDKIILISPWIPSLNEDKEDKVFEQLKNLDIEVLLICGEKDEDCLPLCDKFIKKANKYNVNITNHIIDGLNHDYPENFDKIINNFL